MKLREHLRVNYYWEYIIVSLFVFAPALRRGYIFALDHMWTPHARLASARSHEFISTLFAWLAAHVLPLWIIEKIIFIAAFWLAGVGMHRLVARLTNSLWAPYFAGLLMMFNPWMYSRLVTGQWGIVFAYGLIPWFLLIVWPVFFRPHGEVLPRTQMLARMIGAAGIVTIMVPVAVQSVGLLAVLLGILCLGFLCSHVHSWQRFRAVAWSMITALGLFVGAVILMNAHWMYPALIHQQGLARIERAVTVRDVYQFQTVSDTRFGVAWNVAALYGFWGDQEGRYGSQKELVKYWFILFVPLAALALGGCVATIIRRVRSQFIPSDALWVAPSLAVVFFVALFLALGVVHPWTAPATLWLYHHVPIYKAFRESQKWVALLVISYAILGAYGVRYLTTELRGWTERVFPKTRLAWRVLPVLFIALPLVYSPGLLGGYKGQMCIGQYPASWHRVNEMLRKDPDEFKTVFLPWHLYLSMSFACNKVVANPAEAFFETPVIAGDNIEIGPIYSQSTREESHFIEGQILSQKKKYTSQQGKAPELSLGKALSEIGVKYVIWARESDYFNYDFVAASPNMELVFDAPELKLYRNLVWKKQ